jgi:hypothetical protein
MLSLGELQARFFEAIARVPGGSTGEGYDPALLQVVQARGQLGAQERLDLYATMYYLRFRTTLQADFPAVAAILGAGVESVPGTPRTASRRTRFTSLGRWR